MWNPFDFTGKKIVIAGATSGMGKASAVKLSQQGAEVCLIGRSQEKLNEVKKELSSDNCRCFVKDFSEVGGFQEIFDDVIADGKKIDGLVYCAGIAKILPVSMLSKKNMDESMTVNLYSFAEMVSILSKKKYHDKASVVGISSISTQYPQKCQGIYVATKCAMNGMVTSIAMELAEKGIRINTVLPSSTKTKMYDEAVEGKSDEEIQQIERKQVLGLLNPEDVADVIMFLLSDASKMITGRSIYADAGFINF
ncbi:SDR family NAD(P)-dependent oxidoreductase [uncultured Fibrobacter sp.]|uniref:SDR family NAD(P)-dependent oxidoreductase n=1 Tax=uncultured Fibrobacter sp. TaxID=261512 RepID=UPI0025D4E617|nr:SDR family oxidoreductase [uncultured Fibrobacter sp.]